MPNYPSTEVGVRNWLKDQSSVTTFLSNDKRRVDVDYSSTPDGQEPMAQVVCFRIGGPTDRTGVLDYAMIQIDCWGTVKSRQRALDLQGAVSTALLNLENETVQVSKPEAEPLVTLLLCGAEILSNIYVPSPRTGQHRYILTTRFTARSN
jgi:hypothetical protein